MIHRPFVVEILWRMWWCTVAGMLLLPSCKSPSAEEHFTLRIRIAQDPDCLHPIQSQSALATQIEALVMMPMIEYGAGQLELRPLLVKEVPVVVDRTDSTTVYFVEFREEARWDDGRPITGNDYTFTVKASLNPFIANPSWRSFLKNIHDVRVDSVNERKVYIQVAKDYMLGSEVSGNVNLYPEAVYDPVGVMRGYEVYDLARRDSTGWTPAESDALRRFAASFQSSGFCKSDIQGAGPYRLSTWEAGARIVLERKDEWWGSLLQSEDPLFAAFPKTIEYLVMPDEAAAILALKEGSIDLAAGMSPRQFISLKQDSSSSPALHFYTTGFFQYALLELNLRKPALSEWAVRRALAHLADVDGYIRNVMLGLADPISGPVHPRKSYYNDTLRPISFDPAMSRKLLEDAGWADHNRNGILDKTIDGRLQELQFSLLVSGELSRQVALLLASEARKIGVEIVPESREMAVFISDLNARNFDLAAVTISQQATSLYDPFQVYHSQNARPGGGNRSGLQSPLVDSLIMAIRTTADEAERSALYRHFQAVLYDAQAQIFLFSPRERIVTTHRIALEPILRRPGYLENAVRRQP